MKRRFTLLLNSAKVRNIEVKLNTQYYTDLIEMGCLYCGDSLVDKNGTCLDRQNNSRGYTNDNVVGCCKICNYAKRTLTDKQFYSWVERAYKHQKKCVDMANEHAVICGFKNERDNKKKINIYFNKAKVKTAEELRYCPF